MKRSPLRATGLAGLIGLSITLAGCGPQSGEGLFGNYDAKVVIQSDDVQAARESVRTIVERTHGGELDKEFTDTDTGVFDWTEQSVLTFKVPVDEFDRVVGELGGDGVGVIDTRDRKSADAVQKQSDLSEIYDAIKRDLTDLVGADGGSEELKAAQEQLRELANRSDQPVVVVDIQPAPDIVDYAFGFFANRILWMLVFGGLAFWFGSNQAKKAAKKADEMTPHRKRELAVIAAAAADQASQSVLKEVKGLFDGPESGAERPAASERPDPRNSSSGGAQQRPESPGRAEAPTQVMPIVDEPK